jgi:hypothetical protein
MSSRCRLVLARTTLLLLHIGLEWRTCKSASHVPKLHGGLSLLLSPASYCYEPPKCVAIVFSQEPSTPSPPGEHRLTDYVYC